MSYETRTVELTDLKVSDIGGSGSLSGYASVFGKVDSYGDTIVHGAYADTIPTFLREGFIGWSHDAHGMPVGYPVAAKEDKHGLWLEAAFHSTPEAQLARVTAAERIAAGKTMGLSIGFIPEEFDFKDGGAIRELKKIKLIETSLVLIPAERHAKVIDVKADVDMPDSIETRAEWTAAYVNDLPDSAFAVILPGGEKDSDGKTTPRSLRKLPHHNADGSLDMPHLRNAMSREPQTDMPEAMHSRAKAHLARHMNGGGKADDLMDFDVPFDALFAQLGGWLEYGTDEAEALASRRSAEQRKLSEAHAEAIQKLLSTAEAVSGRLERLLMEPANVKGGTRFAWSLRQRRLAALPSETT